MITASYGRWRGLKELSLASGCAVAVLVACASGEDVGAGAADDLGAGADAAGADSGLGSGGVLVGSGGTPSLGSGGAAQGGVGGGDPDGGPTVVDAGPDGTTLTDGGAISAGGANAGGANAGGANAGGANAGGANAGGANAGTGGLSDVEGGGSDASAGSGGANGAGGTSSTGGAPVGAGGATPDPDAGPPTRDEVCQGAGEVVKVVDTRGGTPTQQCTGSIAKRLFDHAICTCEAVNFAGYLHTQSFNSWNLPILSSSGAPVGVNTTFLAGAYTDVGGTLEIGGATTFAGFLEVGGDLYLATDLLVPGYLQVARDAWLAGNAAVAMATLGRDYIASTSTLITLPPYSLIAGQRRVENFTVPPPCDCAPDELLDIDSIIADGRLNNHNADPGVNLSPTQFRNLIGVNQYTLPCGRYYVDEISGIGSLTLRVDGRTALFIGGDLSLTGVFDVDLGPTGQLDIFVGGNLLQIGVGSFGDPSQPRNVRVFVGGSGDIAVVGFEPFSANLYAPRSDLLSAGAIIVRGSVFVKNMTSGSYTDVAYDRGVLELGDEPECAPPPPPPPPTGAGGASGAGGAQGAGGASSGGAQGAGGASSGGAQGAGGASSGGAQGAGGTSSGGAQGAGGAPPPPPPPQCIDRCSGQCQAGQTCSNNVCGACTRDSDCCAPLVCNPSGKCGPLLL